MKVGDYVRTKDGKIINIQVLQIIKDINCDYVEINYEKILRKNIVKSSPNIIDLIEVGDIVKIEYQGWHQVSIKFETLKFFDDEGTEYLYDEIRAIITKEQLESMEYKVGE